MYPHGSAHQFSAAIELRGWIKKVLKLLAYLFEYTTELYKTYTEYKVDIS